MHYEFNLVSGPAGDLQRRDAEVEYSVPGRRETETVGWDSYDEMAQIRWQTGARNRENPRR